MRLRDYLKEHGIKTVPFAKLIGIHPTLMRGVRSGTRRLPLKYWRKIVKITENKVKLEDLYDVAYPKTKR